MSYYDNSLNEDAAHPHVVAARDAGRDWAEREWDALTEEYAQLAAEGGAGWLPTAIDAMNLVTFPPNSDVEDQLEREAELAEICNEAAAERWNALCNAWVANGQGAEAAEATAAINAAKRDGFEHPRARGLTSAPVGWRHYREVDEADLADALEDIEVPQGADADCIARVEDERASIREAIEALRQGERVRAAADEDGYWFAYEVQS